MNSSTNTESTFVLVTDKAIQQLGRTHRSGQQTAPIYKMVVTELGGERRFASAVSKRMAQLGALTKGDRRAATGSDLSVFDIDSNFGLRALRRTCDALTEHPINAPSRNSSQILDTFVANTFITDEDNAGQTAEENREKKRARALTVAAEALAEIGLTGDPNVVSCEVKEKGHKHHFRIHCWYILLTGFFLTRKSSLTGLLDLTFAVRT